MGDLLVQALKLTVVGMGMTFLSIGALIGGMYVLTGLATDKPQGEAMQDPHLPAPESPEMLSRGRDIAAVAAVSTAVAATSAAEKEGARDPKHIAAAAAVAAAVATQSSLTQPAPVASPQPSVDIWTLHVRSQQLAQRAHYDALRAHRSNL